MNKIFLFTSLLFLLFAFTNDKKTNIWMIGDSTMAKKKPERAPESGWGEELKLYINDQAIVHNHAASGRSTKSFVAQKRWSAVLDSIQPGDYVVIQFGHNDAKPDSLLHTDPYTSFKQYLKKFIDETRSKGGIPIICSSIVRRHFDNSGKLKDTHGDYIQASRQAAKDNKALFVDMEAKSRKLIADLGPVKSKSLFMRDSTHLNFEGSRQIAKLFVGGVKKQKLPLKNLFK